MAEWRAAPPPPPVNLSEPLPPQTVPPSSKPLATLDALSPLASCGRPKSLVLPLAVPESAEPPAYVPFCDQRCQASRSNCAACPGAGANTMETETAPIHYDVAGGTPERASRGLDGLRLELSRTSQPQKDTERSDDATRYGAGRKSVTFRAPLPQQSPGESELEAGIMSRSPRSHSSIITTDSDFLTTSTSSMTFGKEPSASSNRWPSKAMSRASFQSSKNSVCTNSGKERGLFRHHYLEELSAEDKERIAAIGRCSLTNLVARFKEAGKCDVEERMPDVDKVSSMEPRSELLYLRKGNGECLPGMMSVHFSQFVQPNYIKNNFYNIEGVKTTNTNKMRNMDSVMLRSTRKSMGVLTTDYAISELIRTSVKEKFKKFCKAALSCLTAAVRAVLIAATRPRKLATFLACCLIVCIVSFICFVVVGGNYLGDKYLLLRDPALRGDPSYLVDFLGEKCVYLKSLFADELKQLEALNLRLGWRSITLKARDGRAVPALWLPSPMRESPRVIIAHSGLSNYLESAVQTVAYYLRSMNISVLAPNLRHHGGNGELKPQVLRWQMQELDILGAWDYAVSDPEGLLGGPLDDRFVGLLGFDFGAFGVQLAYEMEPRIPAMFLDGAVYKLRELLRQKLEQRVSAWLVWMFDEQAWTEWKDLVHRDLDKDANVVTFSKARIDSGSIAITHCKQDRFIPYAQSEMLLEYMKERSSSGLTGLMQWYPEFKGPDTCERRSEGYMEHREEYRSFLCSFWSKVFDDAGSGNTISPRCSDFGPVPG